MVSTDPVPQDPQRGHRPPVFRGQSSHPLDRPAQSLHVLVVADAGARLTFDFLAVCPFCGWNSGPLPAFDLAAVAVCPVGEAEAERDRRVARYGELVTTTMRHTASSLDGSGQDNAPDLRRIAIELDRRMGVASDGKSARAGRDGVW